MKIGFFGGTFDPLHLGHLAVASDVHARLELDRVIFVPAAVSPHKLDVSSAPAPLRLEMVSAAVAADDRFLVDDLELGRAGPSYSVDTLRELGRKYPDAELWLLVGADALRDFAAWRSPDMIVRLARLAVFAREGDTEAPDLGLPVTRVPVVRMDISATEIRRRVSSGESIRYLVPEPVRSIIEREGLYKRQW